VADRILGVLARLPERLAEWAANLSAPALGAVGVVVMAAVGAGGYYAYRTYDYVQHDNDFCVSCHLMQEPANLFAASAHAGLGCKACHQPTLMARSQMALTQIVENPDDIAAHAEVPNELCAGCHIEGDPDRWRLVASSAGHKAHLESDDPVLEGLQCVECHATSLHEFAPVDKTCAQAGCHQDKKILLAGMSNLTIHCSACHNFLAPTGAAAPDAVQPGSVESALLPDREECFSCHAMRSLVRMPEPDPHQGVCSSCHNPHEQTTPEEAVETCTDSGCHTQAADLSPMHKDMQPGVLEDCTYCHKAHDFKVDGGRCMDCHQDLDMDSPSILPRLHPDTATALLAERVGFALHLPATMPGYVQHSMPSPRRAGREANP